MSADAFNDALESFVRAMRTARMKPGPIPGELSRSQHVLLAPLIDNPAGACSVRELAEAADIASPTATRTLDGLERDGIVTRRPSETDRRSVVVELTEQGREMMLASRKRMRAARAELYARLDPSEQEEAERILRRLTEIIRSI
jgi:DNA-binding MarR family transcriptional regulator